MKYLDFEIRGIDVSQYNGLIDWSKLHDTHFVAVRVGYGRVTDSKFVINWSGLKGKAYRIPYWYLDYYSNHDTNSSAIGISDIEWGRMQAEKCWNLLKDDNEGLLFLDIESASIAPRVETVWKRVEVIAQAFFDEFDKLSGRVNGIYCSTSMLKLFSPQFRNRPLWLAWYTSNTIPNVLTRIKDYGWTGKALIWQYASNGDIDDDGIGDGRSFGLPGPTLDLNAWLGSKEEYEQFTGGEIPEEEEIDEMVQKVKVLITNLRRRSAPSLNATILGYAVKDKIYPVSEVSGDWLNIGEGWIYGSPAYVERITGELTLTLEERVARLEKVVFGESHAL